MRMHPTAMAAPFIGQPWLRRYNTARLLKRLATTCRQASMTRSRETFNSEACTPAKLSCPSSPMALLRTAKRTCRPKGLRPDLIALTTSFGRGNSFRQACSCAHASSRSALGESSASISAARGGVPDDPIKCPGGYHEAGRNRNVRA